MSRIGNIDAYVQNMYNARTQDAAETAPAEAPKMDASRMDKAQTAKAESTSSTVELSDAAQKLLDELKEKYSNADIMVANYSSDEEAQEILSRGTSEYSVLIDPETLEKMAADEDTKNQYLTLLDDSMEELDDVKEQIEESGDGTTLVNIGMTINADGTTSLYAQLAKASTEQRERIEEMRETRKEEQADEKEAREERIENRSNKAEEASTNIEEARDAIVALRNMPEPVQKTTVTASSVDELLENIKNVDWSNIPVTDAKEPGAHFDEAI